MLNIESTVTNAGVNVLWPMMFFARIRKVAPWQIPEAETYHNTFSYIRSIIFETTVKNISSLKIGVDLRVMW